MSPGSFTRSAAQATFSAYRRLPIRWRLAGGSAVLTGIILLGFALIVGTLTTRQIRADFRERVNHAADQLVNTGIIQRGTTCSGRDLDAFGGPDSAQIHVFVDGQGLICQSTGARPVGPPDTSHAVAHNGYYVVARKIRVVTGAPGGSLGYLQYARPLSEIDHTIDKLRIFLILGVLGGTMLALLAGVEVARRAMRPIAELTDAAADIERTRDPSLRVPHPKADDEVAELARTLERMLGALDAARSETEATLERQRAFVADASHELRTPLTSVLANLELLAEELRGDSGEAATSSLRSARRMRRLVADLLLLARADAGHREVRRATDMGEVLVEAASELEPMIEGHEMVIDAHPAVVDGARDDLHRLALNLIENAVRHTPPGSCIEGSVQVRDGHAELCVRDDGEGVPPDLRAAIFERFVRGVGDRGGSSGLGLAIVHAVAESHGGEVRYEDADPGARFIVTLPLSGRRAPEREPAAV